MTDEQDVPTTPEAILSALLRGNERFRAGQALHPHQSPARRQAAARAQEPVAAVLTCADSRVAPELVFDQGLGDLYVVRMAGNVVTDDVLGGLEFAVEALKVGVLLVLGHSLCAAVATTVRADHPELALPVSFPAAWLSGWLSDGTRAPGHLEAVLAAIRPGLAAFAAPEHDALTAAVDTNVRYGVARLTHSPLVWARVAAGSLAVVGARYDEVSGQVSLLEPAPAPH
jgi:carbonic anhydrase